MTYRLNRPQVMVTMMMMNLLMNIAFPSVRGIAAARILYAPLGAIFVAPPPFLIKDKYRITFSKIGKFLLYQLWDKDSVNLNKKRIVKYVSAKEWVEIFKGYNKELEIIGKPLFTPTTIMETEDCNYAFVIHKASLNSCGKVVFTVSTKEISLANNTSKKLIRLPEGKCNNVRFDIDDDDIDDDDDACYKGYKECYYYCINYMQDPPADCAAYCTRDCPAYCDKLCPPIQP